MNIDSTIPVEFQTVLALVADFIRQRHEGRISDQANPRKIELTEPQWRNALEFALRHEITPMVAAALEEVQINVEGQPVLEQFRQHRAHNHARVDEQVSELIRIQALARRQGVRTTFYKGPETVERCGLDCRDWQFNDLDFFVPQQDIGALLTQLDEHGYRFQQEGADLNAEVSQKDYPMVREKEHGGRINGLPTDHDGLGDMIIEPHVQLVEPKFPLRLDYDEFLDRCETVGVLNARIDSFSVEDLLIIMCIAGTKSRWKNLKLVCFIAIILHQTRDVDLSELRERARKIGVSRMVTVGLALADKLLDAPLPEGWMPLSRANERFVSRIIRHKLLNAKVTFRFPPFSMVVARSLESYSDKLSYTYNALFAPNASHKRRYPIPQVMSWMYWLVVPLDHVRTAVHELRQ